MKTVRINETKQLNDTSDHETVALSVDTAGLVHLMGVLTNLYSKPATAVLREYVSNALDSHFKAGVTTDTPIEITLPSVRWGQSNNLIVQDFGVGMSKEEIINVYSRYGSSTKRDSNDEIGGFGLGAKSALAIAERFDVTSIKNGIKTSFYIEKNIQGVGVIHFVSETETKDPSGVTITIPYGGAAVSTEFTENFFIGVPQNALKINGVIKDITLDNKNFFHTVAGTDLETPAGWFATKEFANSDKINSLDPIFAVCGGVVYQISPSSFPNAQISELRKLNKAVVLNLPIGSVDLTPSREELIYSEQTLKTLASVTTVLHAGIDNAIRTELDRIDNPKDAYIFVQGIRYTFWDVSSLTWHGTPVTLTHPLSGKLYQVVAPGVTKNTSLLVNLTQTGSVYDTANFFLRQGSLIILSDNPGNKGGIQADAVAVRRQSRVIREATKYTTFFVFESKEDYDYLWFAGGKDIKFTTTSELIDFAKTYRTEQRKIANQENGGNKVKKVAKPVAEIIVPLKQTAKNTHPYYVEKIYAGDVRLTPKNSNKVLYLKKNYNYSVYPYIPGFSDTNDSDDIGYGQYDKNGFWELAHEKFSKYTIFALNSQKSLSKFKNTYPGAKNLENSVKEFANLKFVPISLVTNDRVKHQLGYANEAAYNNLIRINNHLSEAGKLSNVTNQTFLELTTPEKDVDTAAEQDAKYVSLKYWSSYDERKDEGLRQLVQQKATMIINKTQNFITIASLARNLGEYKPSDLDNIVQFINIIG